MIKLCESPEQSQVTVKITAKVTDEDCRIYSWEWQGENDLLTLLVFTDYN